MILLLISLNYLGYAEGEIKALEKIYPEFYKIVEGKGYIPSIDLNKAERLIKYNDDGKNPFFAYARGEIRRLQKQNSDQFYTNAIERANRYDELFLLDKMFIRLNLLKYSKNVESKILNSLKSSNVVANFPLSKLYEELGLEFIRNGKTQKGIHTLEFAARIAPPRSSLNLVLMKAYFPLNVAKSFYYFGRYFSSVRFFFDRILLYSNMLTFLTVFFALFIISIMLNGFIDSVTYLSRLFSISTGLKQGWIPAAIFSLFVFIPLKYFIFVFIIFSLLKIGRGKGILVGSLAVLMVCTMIVNMPLKNAYSNKNWEYFYKLRYDPVNSEVKSIHHPYNIWLVGIHFLKNGKYSDARNEFRTLLGSERKKSDVLNNIGLTYYFEGELDSALVLFKSTLEYDPKNSVYNFNIAHVYSRMLEFEKASNHFNMAKGIQDRESEGIETYPPDRWVYEVFMSHNWVKRYANIFIIATFCFGIFLIILFLFIRQKNSSICSVCGSPLVIDLELEEKKVCERCYKILSQSRSKGVRERLKRKIIKRATNIFSLKVYLLNLFLPGTAHVGTDFWGNGSIYILLVTALIVSRLSNKILIITQTYEFKSYFGTVSWYILLAITYISILISTRRISERGYGRKS